MGLFILSKKPISGKIMHHTIPAKPRQIVMWDLPKIISINDAATVQIALSNGFILP